MAQYSELIAKHEECLAPLFYAELSRAAVAKENCVNLAEFYAKLRVRWLEADAKLVALHAKMRSTAEEWPSEFPAGTTKPDEAKTLERVARDSPMLSKFARESGVFWNMNRFVEDPEAEHQSFKKRVVWTEEEKEDFVEAYMQHPKKFRVIAKDLPGKGVKDVIEFYYLNRHSLGLKEKEPASRRRAKTRVISEGAIKKE
jgi:hypothetical protein